MRSYQAEVDELKQQLRAKDREIIELRRQLAAATERASIDTEGNQQVDDPAPCKENAMGPENHQVQNESDGLGMSGRAHAVP